MERNCVSCQVPGNLSILPGTGNLACLKCHYLFHHGCAPEASVIDRVTRVFSLNRDWFGETLNGRGMLFSRIDGGMTWVVTCITPIPDAGYLSVNYVIVGQRLPYEMPNLLQSGTIRIPVVTSEGLNMPSIVTDAHIGAAIDYVKMFALSHLGNEDDSFEVVEFEVSDGSVAACPQ